MRRLRGLRMTITGYTKTALSKATEIQIKLDEVTSGLVTLDWCYRLAQRLEPKLTAEAEAKYGSGREKIVHDHILGLAYFCKEDVGKPRQGLWACRWNESLDNSEDCKKYEK